jgi:hypothetical protein
MTEVTGEVNEANHFIHLLCFWALSTALFSIYLKDTEFRRLDSVSVFRWNLLCRAQSTELVPICRHHHLSLSLTLRPMITRPVYLGIKHPFGAYEQIVITVRQMRVWWCGALTLTTGQVCPLQLLLVLASTVIFRTESRGTTASDSRLPFPSPPTTRWATVEVFDPASTNIKTLQRHDANHLCPRTISRLLL